MSTMESPVDAWRRTLHDGNYTPSADVTPEKLADAFGAKNIDEIYNQAFMAAYQRESDTVAWRDFEIAAKAVDAPTEEPHDKAAVRPGAMSARRRRVHIPRTARGDEQGNGRRAFLLSLGH